MKKIYITLFALAALAGCRDSFDIDSLDGQAKLVVSCFPSEEDTTWIEVTYSIPVSKGAAIKDVFDYLEVKDAHVVYRVNGVERPVGWKDRVDDYVFGHKQERPKAIARYYVTGAHQPGDVVELSITAPGYEPVSATTVVAQPVPIELNSVSEAEVYDTYDQDRRSVYQLSATFTDPAASADYYAVRVRCKHYHGTAIGDLRPDCPDYDIWNFDDGRHVEWTMEDERSYENVLLGWGDVYDFHLALDSAYTNPEILLMSEPLLQTLSPTDKDFGFDDDYYQNFYIFSDEKIQGQTYTLHLNLNRWHDQDITYHYRPVQYQVQLYHLTPEFYRYVKSINDVDNNDLAEAGLSMVQPARSNVQGGIGIVGGYHMSQSNWMSAEQ
ncbi:MAG: DUF4249 domain-containing protein [Prevotella sp.]|nr:DUF4249 domain-containing protein [Prevotella sp.]